MDVVSLKVLLLQPAVLEIRLTRKFPGNRSSSEDQHEPVDEDTTVVEPDQGNGLILPS